MCLRHILGTYVGLVTPFCVVKSHYTWNVHIYAMLLSNCAKRLTARRDLESLYVECVYAMFSCSAQLSQIDYIANNTDVARSKNICN